MLVVLEAAGVGGANESSSNTSTSASTKSNTSQTAAPSKSAESSKPAEPATPSTPATPSKPAEKTIELQATATGNGTVYIYKNGSFSNQDFSGSWSKTYTGDEAKGLSSFSVSGDIFNGGNDQQVSCKVIVNGQERDSKSASGSAGSAMCDVPWF